MSDAAGVSAAGSMLGGIGGLVGGGASVWAAEEQARAAMKMAEMADPVRAINLNPYKPFVEGAINNLATADPLEYMRDLMAGKVDLAPGYGFQRKQGLEALMAADAAAGRTGSGAALTAAEKYGMGLASTAFGDAWNRQAGLQNVATTQLNNVLAGYLGASGQSAQLMNAGTAAATEGLKGISSSLGTLTSGVGGITGSLSKMFGSSSGGTPTTRTISGGSPALYDEYGIPLSASGEYGFGD